MTMPVSPGGSYFALYSSAGDVIQGEAVSYLDAVASVAAAGVRDVAALAVPGSLGSPPIAPTHPKMQFVNSDTSYIEIRMTYDNWYWDDMPVGPIHGASKFLVELQGPKAADFEHSYGVPYSIHHYISDDGGQSIALESSSNDILTALTNIKIWRVESFQISEPPNFWTSFIGSHEII